MDLREIKLQSFLAFKDTNQGIGLIFKNQKLQAILDLTVGVHQESLVGKFVLNPKVVFLFVFGREKWIHDAIMTKRACKVNEAMNKLNFAWKNEKI